MSKVDDYVLRMKMESKDFEKNTATTISALEKLKTALNFTKTTDSLSAIEKSANNINFSKLESSIYSIEKRFSAFGIAGMTVIQDLVHAAENLGKKLYSATIGQISSGGWSRALNISNAKFAIEGLKLSWEEVEKSISKAVDNTSFGFDEAASAAAQLGASGVQLGEDMDVALHAISGVAAQTNTSYSEIAHIFTTIAGNGRVMGEQLNQFSIRGMNAAAALGDAMHITEAEVREMVTAGEIDFKTFAQIMEDTFGEHAAAANTTYAGSLANVRAALSRIGADFADPIQKNAIPVYNQLRLMINDIRTSLKPLSETFARFAKQVSDLAVTTIGKMNFDWLDLLVSRLSSVMSSIGNVAEKVNAFKTAVSDASPVAGMTKSVGDLKDNLFSLNNGDAKWLKIGDQFKDIGSDAKKAGNDIKNGTDAAKEGWAALAEPVKDVKDGLNEIDVMFFKTFGSKNHERQLGLIANIVDGLGSAIAIVAHIIEAATDESLLPFYAMVNSIVNSLLELGGSIGRDITAFDNFLTSSGAYVKIGHSLNTLFMGIAKSVSNVVIKIIDWKNRIVEMLKLHVDWNKVFEKAGDGIRGFTDLIDVLWTLFSGLVDESLYPLFRIVKSIGSIFLTLFSSIGKALTSFSDFMKESGMYEKIGKTVNSVLMTLADLFEDFGGTIEKIITAGGKGLEGFFELLSKIFGDKKLSKDGKDTSSALGTVGDSIMAVLNAFNNFMSGGGSYGIQTLISNISVLGTSLLTLLPVAGELIGLFLGVKAAGAVGGIFDTIKQVPKYIKSLTHENNAEALMTLAKAIGLLSIALWGLSRITWDEIARGATAIGVVTIALSALWAVFTKLSEYKGDDDIFSILGGAIKSFTLKANSSAIMMIGVSIGILSASLFALGHLEWEQIAKGVVALAAAISGFVLAYYAITKIRTDGNKANGLTGVISNIGNSIAGVFKSISGMFKKIGLAALITSIGITVLALGKVIVDFSSIPWNDGMKAVILMGAVLAELVVSLSIIDKLSGDNIKLAAIMLSLGLTVKVLGQVVTDLSSVSWADGIKSITLMGGLFAELLISLAIIDKISGDEGSLKLTVFIFALTSAIKALSKTILMLSGVSWKDGIKSVGLMGVLFTELIVALAIIEKISDNDGGLMLTVVMISLTSAIKALSQTILMLSGVSWKDGIKSVGLMGVLFTELIAALAIIEKISDNDGSLSKMAIIASLTAFISGISVSIVMLSSIPFGKGIQAVIMLGILFGEMLAVIGIVTRISGSKGVENLSKFLASFSATVISLTLCVSLLSKINAADLLKSIAAITAISALALGVMALGQLINDGGGMESVKSILPMIAMLAAMTAALFVISNMNPERLNDSVKSLTKVVLSLSVLTAAVSLNKSENIGAAIASFIGLAVILLTITGVFYLLEGIDTDQMLSISDSMSKVINSVSLLAAAIGLISTGKFMSTLGGGAGAIVVIDLLLADIVAIEALAAAINTRYPEFKDFIDKGAPLLESVAGAIGGFIGTLLEKGLLEPLANTFGDLPSQLTDFVTNIEPFLTGSKDLDSTGVDKIKDIMGSLAAIEAEGLVASVLSMFTGEEGLNSVINDLKTFGQGIKEYSDIITADGGINVDAVNASANAASALAALYDNIPKKDGWIQKITGTNSLTGFGEDLQGFGLALSMYSLAIKSAGVDSDAITASANAASAIAALYDNIPKKDGWIQKITGTNSLTGFGDDLEGFATAIKSYSDEITKGNGINSEAIDASANAASALSALYDNIPKTDGWIQKITGSKSLSDYVEDLKGLATGLVDYSDIISGKDGGNGINPDAVDCSMRATQMLIGLANDVPDSGGFFDFFTGKKGIDDFGKALEKFGSSLSNFTTTVGSVTDADLTQSLNAVEMVKTVIDTFLSLIDAVESRQSGLGADVFSMWNYLNIAEGMKSLYTELKNVAGDNPAEIEELKTSMESLGGNITGWIADGLTNTEKVTELNTSLKNVLNGLVDGGGAENGENAFASFKTKFIENIGKVFDDVKKEFENRKDTFSTIGKDIISSIIDGLKDETKVKELTTTLSDTLGSLTNKEGKGNSPTSDFKADFVSAMKDAIDAVIKELTDAKEKFKPLGKDYISELSNGVKEEKTISDAKSAINTTVNEVYKSAEEKAESFKEIGKSYMSSLESGIRSAEQVANLRSAANEAFTGQYGVISSLSNLTGSFESIGENFSNAIARGIRNGWVEVRNAGEYIGSVARAGAEDELRIESPSKVGIQIGEYFDKGIAKGIEKGSSEVGNVSGETAENAVSPFTDMINSINAIMNKLMEDDTFQPKIVPILDLSQVQSGLASVGSSVANPTFAINGITAATGNLQAIQNQNAQSITKAQYTEIVEGINGVRTDLRTLGTSITKMQMVMDSGTVVGEIGNGMYRKLSDIQTNINRGVY